MKHHPFIFLLLFLLMPLDTQAITLDEVNKLKTDFEKKYSISLFYKNIPFSIWKIGYELASEKHYTDLYDYIKMLDEEFAKYPKTFLVTTKLKAIAIVRELSINYQMRTAIPDYGREILFFDFIRGAHDEVYQRHVIHHEFYHMIEQEFNGSAYWKDPEWEKLNEKNTQYGRGGASAQGNSNAYAFTHPRKGFVNIYSKSALEEDKAEIFASLFVKEEFLKVMKWSNSDTFLQKKLKYMKAFLKGIDNDFKDSYWLNLFKKLKQ